MAEWWDGLDLVLRVLYCIAIPSTLILIIQTVLSAVGGFEGGPGVDISDGDLSDLPVAADGGAPGDFGIGSMFTLQGIVTFLTVFGWCAIVAISAGSPVGLSIIIGFVLGVLAMYAVARLIFASRRLVESGTVNFQNAIGETGKVYIPIPPKGQGEGKVNLCVQGRFMECSAVSESEEPMETGASVRVMYVMNEVLVVEREW